MSDHCCSIAPPPENGALKRVLWLVFLINLTLFLVELVAGWRYQSTALLADSLDMFSDAFIYGVSLLVLTKSARVKAHVSLVKGVIMTVLALYVVYELVMRVLQPTLPDGQVVTLVGFLALIGNAVCFWLLFRHRSGDINIQSAWVCSRNDMTANVGVIIAGALVVYTGDSWPDVVIGGLIAVLVLGASFKVITDSLRELRITSS